MKIYILDKKSFGIDNIASAFKRAGHDVTVTEITLDDERHSKIFDDFFDKNINDSFDAVFTFNFFPVISNACKRYNVKYISWVYDSPHVTLYSCSIINDCNYVFIFDKEMYNELYNIGIKTVYYLPLAADVKNLDFSTRAKEYACDASFVGSMYSEPRHNLVEKYFSGASDYTRGYLDGIMKAQQKVSGYFMLEELIKDSDKLTNSSKESISGVSYDVAGSSGADSADSSTGFSNANPVLAEMRRLIPYTANADGVETDTYVYANYFLARAVTAMERKEMAEAVSNICNFHLHTHSQNPVDYYNDMPYVFGNSRINLNITLRSIKSGIPLRAFDIMSCGGFLLSNFQADYLDYFVPYEDFVYYESTKDALDKIKYYLSHEQERKQICDNALGKIKEGHTFDHRVQLMLEVVEG